MEIIPISDLHFECGYVKLPESTNEKNKILIIAGDFHFGKRGVISLLDDICPRFKKVIRIFGNHELYSTGMKEMQEFWLNINIPNFIFLHNTSCIIEDIVFFGTTLWTDFDRHNPIEMLKAKQVMNDYVYIHGKTEKDILTPEDIYNEHILAVNKMKEFSDQYNDYKKVIISHHLMTRKVISDPYKYLAFCYASDLEQLIVDINPVLCIHGHVHESLNYNIGDIPVVCNPRGYYPDKINKRFNPTLTITI